MKEVLTNRFKIEKGTHQGHTLYPLLIILVMEIFASKIRSNSKVEKLKTEINLNRKAKQTV